MYEHMICRQSKMELYVRILRTLTYRNNAFVEQSVKMLCAKLVGAFCAPVASWRKRGHVMLLGQLCRAFPIEVRALLKALSVRTQITQELLGDRLQRLIELSDELFACVDDVEIGAVLAKTLGPSLVSMGDRPVGHPRQPHFISIVSRSGQKADRIIFHRCCGLVDEVSQGFPQKLNDSHFVDYRDFAFHKEQTCNRSVLRDHSYHSGQLECLRKSRNQARSGVAIVRWTCCKHSADTMDELATISWKQCTNIIPDDEMLTVSDADQVDVNVSFDSMAVSPTTEHPVDSDGNEPTNIQQPSSRSLSPQQQQPQQEQQSSSSSSSSSLRPTQHGAVTNDSLLDAIDRVALIIDASLTEIQQTNAVVPPATRIFRTLSDWHCLTIPQSSLPITSVGQLANTPDEPSVAAWVFASVLYEHCLARSASIDKFVRTVLWIGSGDPQLGENAPMSKSLATHVLMMIAEKLVGALSLQNQTSSATAWRSKAHMRLFAMMCDHLPRVVSSIRDNPNSHDVEGIDCVADGYRKFQAFAAEISPGSDLDGGTSFGDDSTPSRPVSHLLPPTLLLVKTRNKLAPPLSYLVFNRCCGDFHVWNPPKGSDPLELSKSRFVDLRDFCSLEECSRSVLTSEYAHSGRLISLRISRTQARHACPIAEYGCCSGTASEVSDLGGLCRKGCLKRGSGGVRGMLTGDLESSSTQGGDENRIEGADSNNGDETITFAPPAPPAPARGADMLSKFSSPSAIEVGSVGSKTSAPPGMEHNVHSMMWGETALSSSSSSSMSLSVKSDPLIGGENDDDDGNSDGPDMNVESGAGGADDGSSPHSSSSDHVSMVFSRLPSVQFPGKLLATRLSLQSWSSWVEDLGNQRGWGIALQQLVYALNNEDRFSMTLYTRECIGGGEDEGTDFANGMEPEPEMVILVLKGMGGLNVCESGQGETKFEAIESAALSAWTSKSSGLQEWLDMLDHGVLFGVR